MRARPIISARTRNGAPASSSTLHDASGGGTEHKTQAVEGGGGAGDLFAQLASIQGALGGDSGGAAPVTAATEETTAGENGQGSGGGSGEGAAAAPAAAPAEVIERARNNT